MTVFLKSTPLIAIIALAGCNSVTEEMDMIPDPDPVSKTVTPQVIDTSGIGTLSVSGTADNPTFRVNGNVVPVNIGPSNDLTFTSIGDRVFKDFFGTGGNSNRFLYGEIEGGSVVVGASQGLGANAYAVSGLSRDGESEIPLTGTAKFTGKYLGLLQTSNVQSMDRDASRVFVQGDVSLDADLAAATLQGDITNRTLGGADPVAIPIEDLSLTVSTADANGVHRGTATGGALTFIGAAATTSNGAYTAMLVGPTGGSVIGTVSVEHDPNGATLPTGGIETGGFFAEK